MLHMLNDDVALILLITVRNVGTWRCLARYHRCVIVTGYTFLVVCSMAPADIIMGWSEAGLHGSVDTYSITVPAVTSNDLNGWALNKGVVRTGATLVMCFTRRLHEPRATVSVALDTTQGVWCASCCNKTYACKVCMCRNAYCHDMICKWFIVKPL